MTVRQDLMPLELALKSAAGSKELEIFVSMYMGWNGKAFIQRALELAGEQVQVSFAEALCSIISSELCGL